MIPYSCSREMGSRDVLFWAGIGCRERVGCWEVLLGRNGILTGNQPSALAMLKARVR